MSRTILLTLSQQCHITYIRTIEHRLTKITKLGALATATGSMTRQTKIHTHSLTDRQIIIRDWNIWFKTPKWCDAAATLLLLSF